MYHRSNRASIGKTSKWHHRMSWLFLYIGHRRTQLCLICDTGSDYMVTTTTEGRAITSSCGSLPTRSWSTKMVMFRPPPCPPWWCQPWEFRIDFQLQLFGTFQWRLTQCFAKIYWSGRSSRNKTGFRPRWRKECSSRNWSIVAYGTIKRTSTSFETPSDCLIFMVEMGKNQKVFQ